MKTFRCFGKRNIQSTSQISLRIYVRRLWHSPFLGILVKNGFQTPSDPKSVFVAAFSGLFTLESDRSRSPNPRDALSGILADAVSCTPTPFQDHGTWMQLTKQTGSPLYWPPPRGKFNILDPSMCGLDDVFHTRFTILSAFGWLHDGIICSNRYRITLDWHKIDQ